MRSSPPPSPPPGPSPSSLPPPDATLLGGLGSPPLQVKVLRGGALQRTIGLGLVVGEIPIRNARTDDAKSRNRDAEQDGPHVMPGDGPVCACGCRTGASRLGRLVGAGEDTGSD